MPALMAKKEKNETRNNKSSKKEENQIQNMDPHIRMDDTNARSAHRHTHRLFDVLRITYTYIELIKAISAS